jgi:hypothetical protein
MLDGEEPSQPASARDVPIEAEHAAWVFGHLRPTVLPSLDHDTRVWDVQSFLSSRGFLSACTVPLMTAHGRLSSLHIAAVQPDAYLAEEVQFLSCVADHVAVAILKRGRSRGSDIQVMLAGRCYCATR